MFNNLILIIIIIRNALNEANIAKFVIQIRKYLLMKYKIQQFVKNAGICFIKHAYNKKIVHIACIMVEKLILI